MQGNEEPTPSDLAGPTPDSPLSPAAAGAEPMVAANQQQGPSVPGVGTVGEALAFPRYEMVPLRGVDKQLDRLPARATATVTCSPTKGPEPTIALTEKIAGRGVNAVPHLAARAIASRDALARILERLDRAGVREGFVVGGDAEEPAGPFAGAHDLLVAMNELGHGLESLGVGAYPETHPLIDDDALIDALHAKQELATYVVTQLSAGASTVMEWLHTARQRGLRLPVMLGLAGPVDKKTLLRVSMKIGVRDSARFFKKNGRQVGQLLHHYDPSDFISDDAAHLPCDRCGIAGFHFYSFNQIERAEEWRQAMLARDGEADASRDEGSAQTHEHGTDV